MTNATYVCNLENGIFQFHRSEIDARNIRHYVAPHNGNQPLEIDHQTMFVAATNENIEQVEVGTFAHPTPIKKRKIVKTVEETSYPLNPVNERVCYTLHHANMNVMKIEQNSIFVTEIVKPKTKRFRRKKYAKRNSHVVANVWKWEDLCFEPDMEPKYDYNVKPNDYAQFLNDPICDPMFCQFDIASVDKTISISTDALSEYDEYESYEEIMDEGSESDDAKFSDA